jgi:hypothetical protein
MSLAGMFETKTRLTPIGLAQVVTTYNGLEGCACGCGGTYVDGPLGDKPDQGLGTAIKRRVTKINANLDKVQRFDGLGYEVIYELTHGRDRVTRVYFEEGRP